MGDGKESSRASERIIALGFSLTPISVTYIDKAQNRQTLKLHWRPEGSSARNINYGILTLPRVICMGRSCTQLWGSHSALQHVLSLSSECTLCVD